MSLYVFLKFLGHLLLPPASLTFGLLIGALLLLGRWRRLANVVGIVTVVQAMVFSLPPVGDFLMRGLENRARVEATKAPPCCYDAILVLGGAIAPADPPDYPTPSLTDSSDRLWHAARLYRRGVAPRIIVSGGTYIVKQGSHVTPEAEAMKLFLVELGVPPDAIVMEGESLNTLENIAFVHQMVGAKPVALVTSAYHMPRALRIARQSGLNVGAFPTDWRVPLELLPPWQRWVPTGEALTDSGLAIWEIMALIFDHRGIPEGP